MNLPTNLIKALLNVISPKHFSPALTFAYYNAVDNKIVWTDSYILLQFHPNTPALSKDFYISVNELKVLKQIWIKDDAIEIVEKEKLLKIWWAETECIFTLDPTVDIQSKFPDTNQPWLFGNLQGEIKKLVVNESMKRFQEIARLIWATWVMADITDKAINMSFTDTFWKYELTMRRPDEE